MAGSRRPLESGYNPACRPGDRGVASLIGLGVEESPDTAGQDALNREAAKADGK
jgi:hypothetical protein